MSKKKPAQALATRLPNDLLEYFLKRHPNVTVEALRSGRRCWKKGGKLVPLPVDVLEEIAASEDPVTFAFLNFTTQDNVVAADGSVVRARGTPLVLYPAQVRMIRSALGRNLILECGSEVGKTLLVTVLSAWAVHVAGAKVLIAVNKDSTAEGIFAALKYQVTGNPTVGGGLVGKPKLSPYREMVFASGGSIQWRLGGVSGDQFLGGHFGGGGGSFPGPVIFADEVAKWKNPMIWNSFWRAAMPGARFLIASTPDGDYGGFFYALCSRATALDPNRRSGETSITEAPAGADEPKKFYKLNIRKSDLPAPFWTEARAREYEQQYHGRDSVGWQTNVEGMWGSPVRSIFPYEKLRPCLRSDLSFYRLVTVFVDEKNRRAKVKVGALAPGGGDVVVADEDVSYPSDRDLGETIASYFPPIYDFNGGDDPHLFGGADIGTVDPTELLIQRPSVSAKVWADVFRLHLVGAGHELMAEVFAAIDCSTNHRLRLGVDNGGAGVAFVGRLRGRGFETCSRCRADSHLDERISAFDFSVRVDEIELDTGETVPNPSNLDAAGRPKPHRCSNKEFSTRILERKVSRGELRIANDGGNGNGALGAAQLLTNHAQIGISSRGDRRFSTQDDHSVDARRFAALMAAQIIRDEGRGGITANRAADLGLVFGTGNLEGSRTFTRAADRAFRPDGKGGVVPVDEHDGGARRTTAERDDRVEAGNPSSDGNPFARGGVRRGFNDF